VAVLDDDRDVAVSLALCLKRAGFETHAFETESALLAGASDVRFDCLIADWSLGRSTARPVIEKLRTMEGYHELPVVVLSGNLCLDGTPASAELRSAIRDLSLVFRAKPRSTADLVVDLREISDQGITI
jgi:FixJ family two-component response regulator